ncbi:MAG TPA: outer membrane protein assembly factor BamE [Burkholderiales bacterium]|nr:outer membrane protein assembly factor BamE [Burkholderiales bacterium]
MPSIPGLGPYKIDIQQGNVITQDMLVKLQPGMTRNQVRFVLGTPLLVDPFRTDRWDYFYSLNKAGERVEQRQLKVYFKDDKMVRYEGDVVVDAKAAVKPAEKPAASSVMTTPESKPQIANPVPAAPAREPDAAAAAKPQLRMAPNEGEPAKSEARTPEPPLPVSAKPAPGPESLETPPLPRLVVPPEPSELPGPAATIPDTPTKP